tara:strand:+ start:252 stop:1268 length:1017 start_codon:yes stop_codon:yes gene_type:complete
MQQKNFSFKPEDDLIKKGVIIANDIDDFYKKTKCSENKNKKIYFLKTAEYYFCTSEGALEKFDISMDKLSLDIGKDLPGEICDSPGEIIFFDDNKYKCIEGKWTDTHEIDTNLYPNFCNFLNERQINVDQDHSNIFTIADSDSYKEYSDILSSRAEVCYDEDTLNSCRKLQSKSENRPTHLRIINKSDISFIKASTFYRNFQIKYSLNKAAENLYKCLLSFQVFKNSPDNLEEAFEPTEVDLFFPDSLKLGENPFYIDSAKTKIKTISDLPDKELYEDLNAYFSKIKNLNNSLNFYSNLKYEQQKVIYAHGFVDVYETPVEFISLVGPDNSKIYLDLR